MKHIDAIGHETTAHADDIAIDRFAAAMKEKMAMQRAKGYGGWDDKADCPTGRLQKMLTDHLAKGDPVDIGNFSMMLWNRGEQTANPAVQGGSVVFGPVAKRRIFDYIRGAYDVGYNDARNARTVPGDGAPGYKGRDVEADHGGALLHALGSITLQPAVPERKPLPEIVLRQLYCNATNYVEFYKAYQAAHGIKEGA